MVSASKCAVDAILNVIQWIPTRCFLLYQSTMIHTNTLSTHIAVKTLTEKFEGFCQKWKQASQTSEETQQQTVTQRSQKNLASLLTNEC
jgi:hypothetical protein